tara:strand:+ start:1247 stop:1480 length:234 start_codon:yes stop_codon:yes gene_type:complete
MPVKKMRGVAVFDLEIEGDYQLVARIELALKEWAKSYIETINQDLEVQPVKIVGHQAALTERRGSKTGPIDKIVFRS